MGVDTRRTSTALTGVSHDSTAGERKVVSSPSTALQEEDALVSKGGGDDCMAPLFFFFFFKNQSLNKKSTQKCPDSRHM